MSSSISPGPKCPRCGPELPADAVAGLCPRCLMVGAMEPTQDGDPAGAMPPPAPEEIAAHFPQLEIIEFLGRGGMGVVYKARQKALGRLVALKLLAPERVADPKFAERFAHEAKALAALSHPSIVTIHDFGQAGGFFYLLMEFVDGVNLRQAMQAGRFTPEQALAIVPPVCEALQYAHEHGIVHRDIKPENLLLDREGRVKIADFGIAKIMGAESPGIGLAESQPAGTPQYMAPEQKEHRATDHRADIYSLGVVLYEMLTGELPADKLQPPSRRVQVDVRIDEIVLRALEQTPELRFQTAVEFRTQVETVAAERGKSEPSGSSAETNPFRTSHALPLWLQLILGAAFVVCLLNFAGPRITHLGTNPEPTFTIGLSQPWLVVHPQYVDDTRYVRALKWNFRSSAFNSGLVALAVGLLLFLFRSSGGLRSGKQSRMFALMGSRDGRRVIVWRNVLAATVAVFAIALIVGAASWLVAKGASPLLIIVALAGIAAFLTVITSVRISFQSGAAPHSEPDHTADPPRLSRSAIVGACWVPVPFLAFVAVAIIIYQARGATSTGLDWWQLAILIPALLMGVAAPFGTTILGWVTISRIRHSAGRVRGLGLALFDALVFPLMALSAVIALAGVAMAKTFVDFYANLSVVGDPHIHPPLVTQMANWLSLNKEIAVIVGVVAAIAVNVLIVRAVRRAVRRELVSAPPESSGTGNEIKTASIAIILALIATALGALAAIRHAGAWPAMALSLLFAGMSIIMALPVRRLGVGKCALIIAALGTVIWPLTAFVVRQTRIAEGANVSGIAKVEVTENRATISQPRYDLEGMIITFGPAGDRWTPAGVYLEAMFDVTLEPHLIGSGANWVMKPRHGTLSGYRLDGPPGPMLGKIVFHPGTPTPEADGAYVIGEFRADKGGLLPIAVRLEKDSAKTVAPPQSSPSGSVLQPEATKGATTAQPATDDSISLAQAVNDFNKRHHDEAVAAKQPDLKVEAVLAAIRVAMQDRANLSVTNATFAALGRLTETQVLPKDFELELLTGYEDDQTTRDVWSVRLRIPGTVIRGGTTCITIHEQQLGSRVIGDEERKVIDVWQEKERKQGGIGSFERLEYRKERDAAIAADTRKKSATTTVDETTAGIGIMLSVKDGKFYVSDVLPESSAATSRRIRQNDTILAVAEGDKPAVPVSGKPLAEVLNMLRGKVGTSVRLTVIPADAKDGRSHEVILTRVNLASLLDLDDATLRSLSWHQFDQTKGQYWRALSDAGRFAEAADLIERKLALNPELDLGWEAINGANLHFHAAQCRALAGDKDAAFRHLAAAQHRQPTTGGLLWNEYLDGTAAFLRGDKASLQAARDRIVEGHEINRPNAAVLDRLISNFGQSYAEAYGIGKPAPQRTDVPATLPTDVRRAPDALHDQPLLMPPAGAAVK